MGMEHVAELTVRISEYITMTATQLTYEGSIDDGIVGIFGPRSEWGRSSGISDGVILTHEMVGRIEQIICITDQDHCRALHNGHAIVGAGMFPRLVYPECRLQGTLHNLSLLNIVFADP